MQKELARQKEDLRLADDLTDEVIRLRESTGRLREPRGPSKTQRLGWEGTRPGVKAGCPPQQQVEVPGETPLTHRTTHHPARSCSGLGSVEDFARQQRAMQEAYAQQAAQDDDESDEISTRVTVRNSSRFR